MDVLLLFAGLMQNLTFGEVPGVRFCVSPDSNILGGRNILKKAPAFGDD